MIKRKSTGLLLTAVLLLALLAFSLSACYVKYEKTGLEYLVDDGTVTIRNYKEQIGVDTLEIPDEIDGMPVVEIADFGVVNTWELKTIKIGKNVAEIKDFAFLNNVNLERFEVDPENEHFAVYDGALYTKDLKTLICYTTGVSRKDWFAQADLLPLGLTDDQKHDMVTVNAEIYPGTEIIRNNAFYKNWYVGVLKFHDGLREIGSSAFVFCESLKEVKLPEGLEKIGRDAFIECKRITSIYIPGSVTEVGTYAFYNTPKVAECIVNKAKADVAGWGKKWWPSSGSTALKTVKYSDD
jgi:hypothetical protein